VNTSVAYIVLSIAVLIIVAILVFFVSKGKRENRLTPLAGLAFGFVLAGILFGDDRLIGYSLMGVGVVLAVIDIFTRSRKAT
jgi:inner membrane protein involved in colicin E2 resistance